MTRQFRYVQPKRYRVHRNLFAAQLSFERLEDRRLLTITWTGDGGDGLWTDPMNWSPEAVPGGDDDVVIGSAGSPTVTIDNDEFANSISVAAGATLSLAQSGFLTVYADSSIDGTLSMSGAALAVDGTGVTLTADGTTTISNSDVVASLGATIDLPDCDSASSAMFTTEDSGTVNVPNLTSVSTAADSSKALTVDEFGGNIYLNSFASSSEPGIVIDANETGEIDLPLLTSLTGAGDQITAGAGSLLVPNLATFDNGSISVDSSASFPDLTNIDDSAVSVGQGLTVSLPGVTSYSNSTGQLTFQVDGSLSLPNLTSITVSGSGNSTAFNAESGGNIGLGALTSTSGDLDFTATGTSSEIDLSKVTSLTGAGGQLNWANSGTILTPLLTTFDNGAISVDDATPSLPDLTNIDGSSVTVSGGSSLALAGITSYTNANLNSTTLEASGTSMGGTASSLTLTNLATISAGPGVNLFGNSGGSVSLPALVTSTGGNVDFETSGTGGSLSLPLLTTVTGSGNQLSAGGNAISVPLLTTFAGGSISITGPAVSYPGLTDIDGTSFTVENGGQLSLLGVTTVNDSPTATTNWNVYAGSFISLPNLTTIDNGPISIGAYDSGRVYLAALPALPVDTSLTADGSENGSGSEIYLPAMTSVTVQQIWTESDHAEIAAPNLTTFDDSSLNISGEQGTYQSLSNIDKSDLDVSGGGSLTLPEVTAYGAAPNFTGGAAWTVTGAGSVLSLPYLASINTGAGLSSTLGLTAQSGGQIQLPGLLTASGGAFSLEPEGAGSLINLPALQTDTCFSNVLDQTGGGQVSIPSLDLLTNFDLQSDSASPFTLLPNQTFVNNGVSSGISAPTLTNEGSIVVNQSNGYLNDNGGLTLNGSGALSVAVGGTLDVSGNLLGNTTNVQGFDPQGTVGLDGSATPSNPQLLEAMSADDGPGQANFANNSCYGTLIIYRGDNVELVDQSHNSSSPSGDPEAIYVNQLEVLPGATLNLNGLHLYARVADISGSLIGGVVTPPGGPITLNTPTAADMSNAGETDAWTFYGQAGQQVTVELNPGGSSYPGSPAALSPTLNYGQVTLLGPNGNVVVPTVASQTSGAVAELVDVTLPSSGTYTIDVQAAASDSSATGDYVLTASVVTPVINPSGLTLDQQYTGNLVNPLELDEWNFAGTAGELVNLQLISAADTNVAYTLVGPGGSTVFSNLQADSGTVSLPASGNYSLQVDSFAGNTGGYSFELQQISVVSLSAGNVPLSVGETYAGTLTGSGYAQLFTVNVPTNEPLNISLLDSSPGDANELYARLGAPPTRGTYNYSAATPDTAEQQLLISSADPGTWYIMVYGNSVPAPSNYTLDVSTSSVALTSVTPSTAATGSTATMILGGSFNSTTTVQLLGAGNSVYNASGVSLNTPTQMSATFNLTGVPQGSYTVQVTNSDGSTAQLPGAFTVTAPGQANLVTNLIIPSEVGRHIASTFYVEYSNTGTVAMPAPVLLLESSVPENVPLFTLNSALQTSGFWTSAIPQGYSSTVQILAQGKVPGMLEPGESVTVPVYYGGMQMPWAPDQTSFAFDLRVFTTTDTDAVDWASLQSSLQPANVSALAWGSVYSNLTSLLGNTWGGYVQMLDNAASYLSGLGEDVDDISQLWQFAVLQADNALLPATQLDTETDIALATPGTLSLDFSREFLAPIDDRQTLGPLGYGWTDDWNYSLSVGASGVTVTMPDGSKRIFQPDSRGSDYFDQPGDYGVLTQTGGGYSLQETDGQIEFFNDNGTLGYIQDTDGNRITAGYAGGLLSSLTSSSGESLAIAYNSSNLIQSVTSSDGRTVSYSYDLATDQLTQVTGYDGTITSYAYESSTSDSNLFNALASITFPDGTQQLFNYYPSGLLAGASQAGGADPITYTYNQGQVTIADANGDASQLFYNEQGLLLKTIDPLGNVSFGSYDGNFNLTSVTGPTGLVDSFTYDSNGNLTSATNPLGQSDTFTYAGPDNSLVSSTDGQGNTTVYQYDSSGDLTSTQNPDGTVSTTTYDALGDPLTIINANGQVTSNTYNAQGQVTSETLADGTSYTFTYDTHGNLATATDATGTTTLSYNSGDELTEVAYPNGQSLTYAYNSGGQRIQMVDQSGNTVNYSYNSVGQLAGLTDGNNHPIVTYVYNNLGQLAVAIDGNGTGSGLGPYTSPYTTYQYNADGNLLHEINYSGGTTESSRFDYTYNALGQVATMTTLDGTWTYSYDSAGELIQADFASTDAIPSQDLTYVYNAAGDRTQTIVNGVTTNYTVNSVNETTSTSDGTTYTYDADGNLLSKTNSSGTTTYTYDSLDRLTSVTSPTDSWIYQYDTLGDLVSTTHNGQVTQNLVDPTEDDVVGQYNSSANLISSYTYGLGLVSQTTAGSTNYYQFDGLGSTADLVSAAGSILNTYSYLPFGGLLNSTGGTANPFTYVGQFGVTSDGSGLLNMGARDYDPTVGQFTSTDPLGLLGSGPNLRQYAINQPTDLIDPTGNDPSSSPISDQKIFGPNYQPAGDGAPDLFFNFNASTEDINNAIPEVAANEAANKKEADAQAAFDKAATKFFEDTAAELAKNAPDPAKQEAELRKATQEMVDRKSQESAELLRQMQEEDAEDARGAAQARPEWERLADEQDVPPSPPGGSAGASGTGAAASSVDPNGLIGPAGFSTQAFVAPGTVLPYEIDFENSPSATAPAQEVTISDPLDPNLNPATFQLTEIAFGDTVLSIPAGTQHYETTVSMTDNGQTFDVDVTAGINLTTDTVFATFISVDPATGLPPDVLTGFLPPEDGTGRGMGKIDYTIQAMPGLPTGTQIRNVANINFDENGLIATDQVDDEDPSQGIDTSKQALVTIDSGAPTSSVTQLPPTETSTTFAVNWSGQDDVGGSGIADYNIYVSDNGGPWTLWQQATTATSANYTGVNGHTYAFISQAIDNVGNTEAFHATADTQTTVTLGSSAPVVTTSGSTGQTFTLGGSAVAVDSAVTVTSSDTDITGASETITNYQSGDTLNFTNQNGITGNYASGVLTLSGSATPAQYQTALQSVTFSTTSTNTTTRTVDVYADDSAAIPTTSNEGVDTVKVAIAAPVVTPSGTTNTFTLGGTAVAVDSGITVTSYDSDLTGATVTISSGTLQSGDTLHFTNQNGISGSYSAGTLTLSGSATPAQYQTALQSVTFSTSSANKTTRSLSVVALDTNDTGSVASNTAAESVNVKIAAPVVTPSGTTNTFTLGGTAVAVDSGITVTSYDSDLTGATVTISSGTLQSGDTLHFTNQNGISGSYSAGTLTLSGSATPAQYQTALQSVTFSTSSANKTTRSLSVVALDTNDTGSVASNTAAESVNVKIAAPVVTPSGTTNTFTLGGTAVAVDSGITVTSYDSDLTGATVTISSGTLQSGDTLHFTNQNGISGSYSAGTLTLSGSATPAQYQTALQSVTFSTSSANKTTRSLSVVALDTNDTGSVASNTAAESVNVKIAAPVVTPSGTINTFTLGGTAVAVDSGITVTSYDSDLTGATVTISSGTLQSGDTLHFTNQNGISGSYSAGTLTLSGSATPAQYQTALQSVTFSTTSANKMTRSLSVVALDTNDTGSVASNTAAESVNVKIAAPVVTPSGTINTFTLGGTAVAVDSGITVTSYDSDLTGATVTISSGTLQSGDTLHFTNQNGISGSYTGGVLTLSGIATPSQYQTALQSITFSTTSTNTTARSLSIVALDTNDTGSVASNTASEAVDVTASAKGTISGTVDFDVTGNGQSADDTPESGVKVYLDLNNSGQLTASDPVVTTGSNGSYSFTGLAAGTYTVREVVPTGQVRTAPTLSDHYTITLASSQTSSGNNFDNAQSYNTSIVSNVVYVLSDANAVTTLQGNTVQGEAVEVSFTVAAGSAPTPFSLVSYIAPGPTYVASQASQQVVIDADSGTFGPGSYTLDVVIPHSYYQIDFVVGNVINQLGPAGSNIFYSAQNRLISSDNGGTQAPIAGAGEITGYAYLDANNNGKFDPGERAVPGTVVTLNGTASNGHSVTESAVTDADGLYMFDNLPAGTYAISETPPTGYTNGLTTIGSVSGTVQTGKISNIHLGAGVDDTGNDFGMQQTVSSPLAANQTGSIAFWNGSSGQALIKALNGGPSATALSNYLASTFPDIYGKSAVANNLTGKTNAQVASFYQQFYNESGPKLDAETLALALSTYVTKSSLAGNTATSYGFAVSANGSATATFNVGTNGVAFGVDDNTTLTIMDLLTLTDVQAHKGLLWDLDGNGSLSAGETMLRLEADELFDAINSY